ncbi:hypothetical protein ACFWVT_10025 [Streptomyces cyaneofuscatus]|uniref:hypothetical protein n=1 Tax=Streptomyces cyaneofuscatus TaxID=66883 RepID=UPI00365C9C5B
MMKIAKSRIVLRTLLVAAALGAVTGTTLSAPAQAQTPNHAQAAASCNSTRVCFIAVDGSIRNLDPDAIFPKCSSGLRLVWENIDKARNRSNRALSVYAANGAPLSRLDPGETIDYNANARYSFCIWGL